AGDDVECARFEVDHALIASRVVEDYGENLHVVRAPRQEGRMRCWVGRWWRAICRRGRRCGLAARVRLPAEWSHRHGWWSRRYRARPPAARTGCPRELAEPSQRHERGSRRTAVGVCVSMWTDACACFWAARCASDDGGPAAAPGSRAAT